MSTSEAKYLVINYGAKERVWVKRFLKKIFPKQAIKRMEILKDIKISFTLTKNLESHNYTKYINVIYYHIQELVDKEKLGSK